MFVYATPLIGGWLADRFLGYRRSVLLGGVFFIAGYCLLGLGSVATYYIALALIFVGNGFFKPNISTMVGNLYPAGSPLKDSAYNIFYMGINIGALLAPVVGRGMLCSSFAGPTMLEAAKTGETLTPEQAASLRSGFLAAFFAAAAGMTLGTVHLRRASIASWPPSSGGTSRSTTRPTRASPSPRTSRRPKRRRRRSTRCPSGRRITALLVIYGDRDRLLDGLPPERQHDDLLGRREHRLERLGRRSPTRSTRSGSSSSRSPW